MKNEERDEAVAAQTKGGPLKGPTSGPISAPESSAQDSRGKTLHLASCSSGPAETEEGQQQGRLNKETSTSLRVWSPGWERVQIPL